MPCPRAVAAVLLASNIGCTSWRTEQLSPTLLASQVVRATLSDGRRLVLRHPQIVHDSLHGLSPPPVSLPLSDIRRLEAQHIEPGKSIALGLGLAAVAAFLVVYGDDLLSFAVWCKQQNC